jgi:hypothetical protein
VDIVRRVCTALVSVAESFSDERLQDEQFREKTLVWIWLPFVIVLPILGLLMFASAIVEFAGTASGS